MNRAITPQPPNHSTSRIGIDEATTLMMLPLLVGGQPRGLWLLGVDVMARMREMTGQGPRD